MEIHTGKASSKVDIESDDSSEAEDISDIAYAIRHSKAEDDEKERIMRLLYPRLFIPTSSNNSTNAKLVTTKTKCDSSVWNTNDDKAEKSILIKEQRKEEF